MKKEELKKLSGKELSDKIYLGIKSKKLTKEQARQILKLWYAIKEEE